MTDRSALRGMPGWAEAELRMIRLRNVECGNVTFYNGLRTKVRGGRVGGNITGGSPRKAPESRDSTLTRRKQTL